MASPHAQLNRRAVVAGAAALVPAPENMDSVPSILTKRYFPRGPLQQFRFVDSTSFRCFRCSETKKSKLIAVYSGDWSKRICTGCHERLLSLYEIKAGTAAEDQKAEDLVAALVSAVAEDDQCQAEMRLKPSEKRAEQLSAESVRFIATAEHVAGQLQEDPHLEWSPAVIGLCKAVESEVVVRILRPLAASASREDLRADKSDKDLGRVATFCADQARKPPELGVFAHFLQTAIHSQQRRTFRLLPEAHGGMDGFALALGCGVSRRESFARGSCPGRRKIRPD